MSSMKKTVLSVAVLMALGSGAAYATPTNTTGNNFTMIAASGGLQGGTNDVTFTWDGTVRTSVVTNGTSNATLTSPTKFAGFLWTAHNINIYGTGTYVFDTTCPTGNPSCGTGTASQKYTLTVPAGYLGGHMLFNWNTSANIDVIQLWKINDSRANTPAGNTDPFCAAPLTNGGCTTNPNPNGNTRTKVWSLVSVDTNQDADAWHGSKMIDGPFVGSSANFNVTAVPVPAAVWLFGSGLLGLVGVARRKKK